jgi:hypothetical protein
MSPIDGKVPSEGQPVIPGHVPIPGMLKKGSFIMVSMKGIKDILKTKWIEVELAVLKLIWGDENGTLQRGVWYWFHMDVEQIHKKIRV